MASQLCVLFVDAAAVPNGNYLHRENSVCYIVEDPVVA